VIGNSFLERLRNRRWVKGRRRRRGRERFYAWIPFLRNVKIGPRIRPRRGVNVANLVAAPEDLPARPILRIRIVASVIVILFFVMVLRLWSLQVIDHRTYAAAVNQNQVRAVTVPAPRGLIVDRHDVVLVGNTVQNELVLSREAAHNTVGLIGRVASLIGETPAAVNASLNNLQYSPYQPVPVSQNVSSTTIQYLEAHRTEFHGVSVEQVTARDYPQGGTTATDVLGYVGAINATELKAQPNAGYTQTSQIGKAGIEERYEPVLRGTPGTDDLEVNPSGTVVGTLHKSKPIQGDTVVLNVTTGLQQAVQSALATDILNDRATLTNGKRLPATNGAAVVLNVETGAVLAMASYPSYSLTEWVGGITAANYAALKAGCTTEGGGCPLNNYAIDGLYTPGSTFKLATATAGLDYGLITPTATVDDTGTFRVPTCTNQCTFHDDTSVDAGNVNVSTALTRSSDYFFYTLGYRFFRGAKQYGANAIQQIANDYGFGKATKIDLPGEAPGRVDSQAVRQALHAATPRAFPNTYWYTGTSIEMAFGQGGTVVTPLEVAQSYATFADHGVKHQPEVAGAIVSPSGKVVKEIKPKVTGHVTLSNANFQALLKGFLGVTHTASGTAAGTFAAYSRVPATYPIAGKTGTATTATATRREPNAWFVGFGPTNSTHEYVVAVAVAQGGYGANAAAPAVANIFNYLYQHPVATTLTLPTQTKQPTNSASTSTTTTAPSSSSSTSSSTSTTLGTGKTTAAQIRSPRKHGGRKTTGVVTLADQKKSYKDLVKKSHVKKEGTH